MSNSHHGFDYNRLKSRPVNGFTLLEIAIITSVIAILLAIAVPSYLKYETRSKSAEPMIMLDTLREQVAVEVATSDGLLQCNDNLVDQANLQDPYMEMKIIPLRLDSNDPAKGFGAGLVVTSDLSKFGVEGVQVAKEFYYELEKGQNEKLISGADDILTDSVVHFKVLLSRLDEPVCSGAASPTQSPPKMALNCAADKAVFTDAKGKKSCKKKCVIQYERDSGGACAPILFTATHDPRKQNPCGSETATNGKTINYVFIPEVDPWDGSLRGKCEAQFPAGSEPYADLRCKKCIGPIEICETLYEEVSCAWPNNYCVNHIKNDIKGQRTVERGCGSFKTVYNNWYVGTSDNDKCRRFDEQFVMTLEFECTYACRGDNCNKKLHPLGNTLWKDLSE